MADETTNPPSTTPEDVAAGKEQLELTKAQLAALEEKAKLKSKEAVEQQKIVDGQQKELDDLLKQNDALAKTAEYKKILEAKAKVLAATTEEQAEAAQEQFDALAGVVEKATEHKDELELAYIAQQLLLDGEKDLNDILKEIGEARAKINAAQEAEKHEQELINEALADAKALVDGIASSMAQFADVAGGAFSKMSAGVTSMTMAMADMGQSIQGVEVDLRRATGFTSALDDDMSRMVEDGYEWGTSMADSAEVLTGLNSTMTQFAKTMKDPAAMKALTDQAIELRAMGASAEDFGQTMDHIMRSLPNQLVKVGDKFIKLGEGPEKVGERFKGLAADVRRPVGEILKDFNALAPKFAKFGDKAIDVFEGLTKQARSFGITIQEAFDLTDQLDTFEGSSQMIGTLNAQLGIQLNSVELMAATDEKRLELLTTGIKEGLEAADNLADTFDDLHRREKQAIAQMMNVPVGTAARLLGDPSKMHEWQKQQETNARLQEKMVKITDRLATVVDRLTTSFRPMIDGALAIVEFFGNKWVANFLMVTGVIWGVIKSLVLLGKGIVGLHGLSKMYTAFQIFQMAIGWKTKAQIDAQTASIQLQSAAQKEKTLTDQASVGPTIAAGNASMISAAGVLKLAGAVALMGLGIAAAALGLATLAESIALLSGGQILGLLGVVVALTGGMWGVTVALVGLTPAAAAAAPFLSAIALAFLGMGAGIGLAAAGIALIAYGFAEVIKQLGQLRGGLLFEVVAGFQGIAISVAMAAAAMGLFMMALASGVGGFALAASLAVVAGALYALSTASEGLGEAAPGIQAIEQVITATTKVSGDKLEQLDSAMESIAKVGVTMAWMGPDNIKALADVIKAATGTGDGTGAGGGGGGKQVITRQPISLEIENKGVLGTTVVEFVKKEYGFSFSR